MQPSQDESNNSMVRWYIDTRGLTATTSSLPLLETLQPSDQESAKRFYHLKDKHMSLASNLLKYLFIHRTCRIPWNQITISRTPAPHHRPYFNPADITQTAATDKPIPSIEFNVSHQASLVALAGTILPPPSNNDSTAPTNVITNPNPTSTPSSSIPQVGIDITCVDERRNTAHTRQALEEFVSIFSEVFSQRELDTIKSLHGAPSHIGNDEDGLVEYGFRLFYTYWALKEAYIKMTGEALLAPWLKELVFTNVVAPEPAGRDLQTLGEPYTGVKTWLYGKEVDDVRVEVIAFEKNYLIATAARGGRIGRGSGGGGADPWQQLQKIDIEEDVRPCATGVCQCLK
ncbi:putative aflYg/ npgA protein [Aspergillus nomiae NRRL 13137]|uniref:holo-[acyl-carrier-protein] synthase n=1 Tax=Aspergillus nomiae NRRL (strain ATCC 15546 / NRRL 13137 / CBS 260.88 / M93) TaxID=1509407 RepID=A0A0L1ITF8_ASPN3|nr:putative aflYg/ npgA protein [Aspergillus nomiae NRRL 13137]KNG82774.1 putative aflYg/ npgA protein [Aspergillus nomiae NRRL 13137]